MASVDAANDSIDDNVTTRQILFVEPTLCSRASIFSTITLAIQASRDEWLTNTTYRERFCLLEVVGIY